MGMKPIRVGSNLIGLLGTVLIACTATVYAAQHQTLATIDVPGAVETHVATINAAGVMVGNYFKHEKLDGKRVDRL